MANVTVTAPPTVGITTPTNGAYFSAPASITINATASRVTSTITKVKFYSNGALIGTDSTSPYTYTWNNVPGSGATYALTAESHDANA